MSHYVSLHTHSEWSLLDGLGTSDQLAKRAAELGHTALAITDHGTLSGALYHIEACKKYDIKPIVGCEMYFRHDIEADKEAKDNLNYYHLLLLAKTEEGFRNLMRLSSASYRDENFYQKPCIDWRLLRSHSKGLICSSSCLSGVIPSEALRNDPVASVRYLRAFKDIFKDDFYIEIQPHDIDDQRICNVALRDLAYEDGIPLVAANDVHYPYCEWSNTQDILVMIATGQSKTKREKEEQEGKGYMKFSGESFYLMTADQIFQEFMQYHRDLDEYEIGESIKNTVMIADRCEGYEVSKAPKIPKATKSSLEAERIIRKWIEEGLERINKKDNEIYLERVEHELAVMKKLKVLDYFVIVADMVKWAKKEGIRVGAARGSAAGCLVNYLIGITALDPIGYGLLFERFLNEYRTELPDIDIDFQDDRRDEVRDYLVSKWGNSHVVDVASFQTFGLKAVIQDVARVLSVPYPEVRVATDSIPDKSWNETLDSLEQNIPKLHTFFEKYPEVKEHAIRLQGQAKNQSKHAAAVIITDRPARDLIPMMRSKQGEPVTQWTERANAQLISPYGFLKIDLLSTDALTIQQLTIDSIYQRTGRKIEFENNEEFPVNEDPTAGMGDVFQRFSKGHNLGIFQMGSSIMRNLLKEINPTTMDHLIAANALIRPGTERKEYARRKNATGSNHISSAEYGFLLDTYGVLCYQEQFITILRDLGGIEDASIILKIVSKGIARDKESKKKLQNYEKQFKANCKSKGIEDADRIWNLLTAGSSEYLFNKSHATGYALQAYQDMWLKVNYPLEFYTALLTVESGMVPEIIREMKGTNIVILPPDINSSGRGFTIDASGGIRFGLHAIKGLGVVTVEQIMQHRPFESFEDMLEKMPTNKLTKTRKEALFAAGALDCWGARTKWLLNEETNARIPGALSEHERLVGERETLGLVVSQESDVYRYKELLEEKIVKIEDLQMMENQEVLIGGEIINVKEHKTRNGDTMAFVDLEYEDNQYNLTLWPKLYDMFYPIVKEGNVILAIGDWDSSRHNTVVRQMVTAAQYVNDN